MHSDVLKTEKPTTVSSFRREVVAVSISLFKQYVPNEPFVSKLERLPLVQFISARADIAIMRQMKTTLKFTIEATERIRLLQCYVTRRPTRCNELGTAVAMLCDAEVATNVLSTQYDQRIKSENSGKIPGPWFLLVRRALNRVTV